MIKIKINKGRAKTLVKGERFETANEAVNVAVSLVEHFESFDKALGEAVRKTIIGALDGSIQPGKEAEAEQ